MLHTNQTTTPHKSVPSEGVDTPRIAPALVLSMPSLNHTQFGPSMFAGSQEIKISPPQTPEIVTSKKATVETPTTNVQTRGSGGKELDESPSPFNKQALPLSSTAGQAAPLAFEIPQLNFDGTFANTQIAMDTIASTPERPNHNSQTALAAPAKSPFFTNKLVVDSPAPAGTLSPDSPAILGSLLPLSSEQVRPTQPTHQPQRQGGSNSKVEAEDKKSTPMRIELSLHLADGTQRADDEVHGPFSEATLKQDTQDAKGLKEQASLGLSSIPASVGSLSGFAFRPPSSQPAPPSLPSTLAPPPANIFETEKQPVAPETAVPTDAPQASSIGSSISSGTPLVLPAEENGQRDDTSHSANLPPVADGAQEGQNLVAPVLNTSILSALPPPLSPMNVDGSGDVENSASPSEPSTSTAEEIAGFGPKPAIRTFSNPLTKSKALAGEKFNRKWGPSKQRSSVGSPAASQENKLLKVIKGGILCKTKKVFKKNYVSPAVASANTPSKKGLSAAILQPSTPQPLAKQLAKLADGTSPHAPPQSSGFVVPETPSPAPVATYYSILRKVGSSGGKLRKRSGGRVSADGDPFEFDSPMNGKGVKGKKSSVPQCDHCSGPCDPKAPAKNPMAPKSEKSQICKTCLSYYLKTRKLPPLQPAAAAASETFKPLKTVTKAFDEDWTPIDSQEAEDRRQKQQQQQEEEEGESESGPQHVVVQDSQDGADEDGVFVKPKARPKRKRSVAIDDSQDAQGSFTTVTSTEGSADDQHKSVAPKRVSFSAPIIDLDEESQMPSVGVPQTPDKPESAGVQEEDEVSMLQRQTVDLLEHYNNFDLETLDGDNESSALPPAPPANTTTTTAVPAASLTRSQEAFLDAVGEMGENSDEKPVRSSVDGEDEFHETIVQVVISSPERNEPTDQTANNSCMTGMWTQKGANGLVALANGTGSSTTTTTTGDDPMGEKASQDSTTSDQGRGKPANSGKQPEAGKSNGGNGKGSAKKPKIIEREEDVPVKSQLFEDYHFILTGYVGEASHLQTKKSKVATLIKMHGGDFLTIPEDCTIDTELPITRPHVVVVADKHCRTLKYLAGLALGVALVSHKWVKACVSKAEIIAFEESHVLARGVAANGDIVECRPRDLSLSPVAVSFRALYEKTIVLAGEKSYRNRYGFLVKLSGANVVFAPEDEGLTDEFRKILRECTCLLADTTISPALTSLAIRENVPIMGREWVMGCLLSRCAVECGESAKYHYNYAEDASSDAGKSMFSPKKPASTSKKGKKTSPKGESSRKKAQSSSESDTDVCESSGDDEAAGVGLAMDLSRAMDSAQDESESERSSPREKRDKKKSKGAEGEAPKSKRRSQKETVVERKVERVGEPYESKGKQSFYSCARIGGVLYRKGDSVVIPEGDHDEIGFIQSFVENTPSGSTPKKRKSTAGEDEGPETVKLTANVAWYYRLNDLEQNDRVALDAAKDEDGDDCQQKLTSSQIARLEQFTETHEVVHTEHSGAVPAADIGGKIFVVPPLTFLQHCPALCGGGGGDVKKVRTRTPKLFFCEAVMSVKKKGFVPSCIDFKDEEQWEPYFPSHAMKEAAEAAAAAAPPSSSTSDSHESNKKRPRTSDGGEEKKKKAAETKPAATSSDSKPKRQKVAESRSAASAQAPPPPPPPLPPAPPGPAGRTAQPSSQGSQPQQGHFALSFTNSQSSQQEMPAKSVSPGFGLGAPSRFGNGALAMAASPQTPSASTAQPNIFALGMQDCPKRKYAQTVGKMIKDGKDYSAKDYVMVQTKTNPIQFAPRSASSGPFEHVARIEELFQVKQPMEEGWTHYATVTWFLWPSEVPHHAVASSPVAASPGAFRFTDSDVVASTVTQEVPASCIQDKVFVVVPDFFNSSVPSLFSCRLKYDPLNEQLSHWHGDR